MDLARAATRPHRQRGDLTRRRKRRVERPTKDEIRSEAVEAIRVGPGVGRSDVKVTDRHIGELVNEGDREAEAALADGARADLQRALPIVAPLASLAPAHAVRVVAGGDVRVQEGAEAAHPGGDDLAVAADLHTLEGAVREVAHQHVPHGGRLLTAQAGDVGYRRRLRRDLQEPRRRERSLVQRVDDRSSRVRRAVDADRAGVSKLGDAIQGNLEARGSARRDVETQDSRGAAVAESSPGNLEELEVGSGDARESPEIRPQRAHPQAVADDPGGHRS